MINLVLFFTAVVFMTMVFLITFLVETQPKHSVWLFWCALGGWLLFLSSVLGYSVLFYPVVTFTVLILFLVVVFVSEVVQ